MADAPGGNPELILIASGSEVSLAVEAYERLLKDGIRARVVSMPSWDIFEHQTREYRDSVLPPNVKARVAVEQASTFGWERYVGEKGRVIGMQENVQQELGDHVSAARSQPYYLDVTHPAANKGSVVDFLSAVYLIPSSSIATLGDMPNDVLPNDRFVSTLFVTCFADSRGNELPVRSSPSDG